MSGSIESVAVLGAGTMGAGIAGLAASKGCKVLLLDMTTEAVEKGLGQTAPEDLVNVTTGTFDQDLDKLAESDWIVEAIVENLEIKRSLFERVELVRKDGSIISSNTSGIPLRDIAADMPERFQQDVAITHFFNPVKVMKLLEVVPGEQMSADTLERLRAFAEDTLGKGVVNAKDTVNFIGNRIGCFHMLAGLHTAKPFLAAGMTQETIDAVLGKPVGIPPTGLYGLMDLIGLDVMDLVGKNLAENLPSGDVGKPYTSFPAAEQAMLERGQLGRKSRALGGFGRVSKLEDGSKKFETFDLNDQEWRAAVEPELSGVPADLGHVLFADTAQGQLAWEIYGATLRYSADLVPEIADDIVNIDNAMKWGFGWVKGPFEMFDMVGPDRFIARLEAEELLIPAMLRVLTKSGGQSFYRDGGSEYLGVDGTYHSSN
jgi:3-hydroxyacyl-CoA dehydrogenase